MTEKRYQVKVGYEEDGTPYAIVGPDPPGTLTVADLDMMTVIAQAVRGHLRRSDWTVEATP